MYFDTKAAIHSPAYKLALIRRVQKRYYTTSGRIFPKLFKAMELNDANLKEIADAMFECTRCRRCTIHCPLGIDPAWPVSAGRYLVKTAGKAPSVLSMVAQVGVEKAKNISLYEGLYLEQIKILEDQLSNDTKNPNARIPVKNQDADILYVPIAGAHSIIPAAKIFNAVGEDWSLSQFEANNYSYFLGDIEAAKWFNRTLPFQVKSIAEVMAKYIEEGRIKLDPSVNPGTTTYHDPCQLARNGGVYEEPRAILRASVEKFRELAPPNKEYNWCCGGGGGLIVPPDLKELRMKTGKRKAEQIKQTKTTAIASMCENCRSQLVDLNEHYNLGVRVTSLIELMANAIKQEGRNSP